MSDHIGPRRLRAAGGYRWCRRDEMDEIDEIDKAVAFKRDPASFESHDGPDGPGVARDDDLVESLAGRQPVPVGPDELGALLAEWCAGLDREPASAPAGMAGQAGAAARPVRRTPSWRRPNRRAVVAVAVSGTVLLTGLAGLVGAERAEPGSPLWPVTSLVDHHRAMSVTSYARAEHALGRADDSLAQSRLGAAERELVQARGSLRRVRARDGRAGLATRLDRLWVRLGQARRRARTRRPATPAGWAGRVGLGASHPIGLEGHGGRGRHGRGTSTHLGHSVHSGRPVQACPNGRERPDGPVRTGGPGLARSAGPGQRPDASASAPSANPRAYSHDT